MALLWCWRCHRSVVGRVVLLWWCHIAVVSVVGRVVLMVVSYRSSDGLTVVLETEVFWPCCALMVVSYRSSDGLTVVLEMLQKCFGRVVHLW